MYRPKEKKETRSALFQIWDEGEWAAFEAYHDSHDFLWRENEGNNSALPSNIDFPALSVTSPRIADATEETPQERELAENLRLQSLCRDIPLLSYCFAVVKKYPHETLPAPDAQPLDAEALHFLLSPPTVLRNVSVPVFPVPPLDTEQVTPYPAQVTWTHVNEWDMVKPMGAAPLMPAEAPSEFALNPLGLTGSASELALQPASNGQYTGVERLLAAWGESMTAIHNENADYEIDSFLYGTPDLEKNRYTLLPEKLSAPASFNLSFFVSKTSDLSESTKNKRNRKRQRDGAEAEEKAKPGSIGNHIYRRLNHSFIWSKKEDEMLVAMVLQFGTGWAFICSVFLLEEVNYRARLRRDCSMRWAFLEKNRDVISAAVPSEARFFLIPRYSLSHRKNEFAESVKLATSTAEASQRSDEAAQQTAEKVTSPLQALFTSVRTKAVDSALFEANALPASFEAKLKEVDSAFVAAEADPSALLRRYLRPDPPSSFKSTITKPAALRSPPAVGTLAMDAGNDTGKSQSGSVPIRPISVPRPPNVIELRHKAAEALPLAVVTFEDDTKFKHLLNPGRKPQENIIVPYPSALVDARRLLEEKNLVLPEVKEEPREPDAVSTGEPPFGLLPLELKELGDFGSLAGKDSVPLGLLGEEEEKEEAKEARRNELDDICCDDAPEEKKAATPLLTRDLPVQTPVPTPLAAPPAASLHEPPFVEWVTEMSEATEDGVTGRKRARREDEEMPPLLKLQRLADSSARRLEHAQPSKAPHAFYTSAPQLARSNMRFLQHYLTTQKQQLRNPKPFPQATGNVRKEGSQSNVVVNNTVTEVRMGEGCETQVPMQGYGNDLNHARGGIATPMNGMMYRNAQNMQGHIQFPNSMQQQKTRMSHGNQQVQTQGGNGGNYQGNHVVCVWCVCHKEEHRNRV